MPSEVKDIKELVASSGTSSANDIQELGETNEEVGDLAKFLIEEVRVVNDWQVDKVIGNGANGVVLIVRGTKGKKEKKAVMKVALNNVSSKTMFLEKAAVSHYMQESWEESKTAHLVRLVDFGFTFNQEKERVSYMVMEMLPGNPVTEIASLTTIDGIINRSCEFGLQMLKALYDLHSTGLIHRDIKPENVGLYDKRLLVMYDMGMARIMTDREGRSRTPRSFVGLRGTDEWASLEAELGREQSRLDDLWGWFYTMVEWVNCKSGAPLPWANYDSIPLVRQFMKSIHFPAHSIYANCPSHFAAIMLYLHMLDRNSSPDYAFLAEYVRRSRRDTKNRRPPQPTSKEINAILSRELWLDW